MPIKPYDETSPKSIEAYSQKLIGQTFSDVLTDFFSDDELIEKIKYFDNPRSKGGLGNLIEEYFYYYKPNSNPEPDFPKAGVELKVTPYEELKNGKYRAGERLVIGMIPNDEPVIDDFYQSHVLDKLGLVLLVLYLRRKDTPRTDFKINYVKLFSVLSEVCKDDLAVIKSDYEIIVNKIKQGKAHELSESDTMYLGACTKGATAAKSLQKQFYNPDVTAKRRAYSLKQGYMSDVLNKYVFNDVEMYDSILKTKPTSKEDFESNVINTIMAYKNQKVSELRKKFELTQGSKSDLSVLSFRMLGVKSNNAEEFVKSDTIVKTIRLQKNGKMKESMSFPSFKFKEFIEEEWEESEVYRYFSEKRFLFVIFQEDGDDYRLVNAKFWNMPMDDLDVIGKAEWESVQQVIKNGVEFDVSGAIVKNNFPKKSETKMFHVRPHAKQAAYLINGIKYGNGEIKRDADELPNGDLMTKQSFWLNNSYVLEELNINKN